MERIPGGKARGGRCPRNVDKTELAQGIKVELEHTNDRRIAREIACDHLTEDGRYYSKLATIHLDGRRRSHTRRALGNPAAPTFTVYERNEMTGHANYVGTFASQADAQAYVDRQVARSRKFATFEVWTGTPKAPRKPVPGTTARGLHGVTDPRRGEAYNLDVAALRKGDTLDDFGTIVRVAKVHRDGTISLEVRAKGPFGVKWYPDRRLKPHAMAHMRTVQLDGDDLAGGRRRTATPAAPALPTLPEAEHAEWTAAQAVTAALRSRDPAKIAQAKAALATANEATFQAWGRLPAAERLRRRAAGTAPDGM